MSDADSEFEFSTTFIGANGRRQRIRYEPRSFDDGHWRIVEERVGRSWRRVLREPVRDLDHDRQGGTDPSSTPGPPRGDSA